ncbi:MAG: phosphoglycerate dehydrogenase [Anaerolineae bacterium]|jgi:D-3-phosphoglycerate dehydrogenase
MTHKILITDDLSSQGLAHLESAGDVKYDVVKGLAPEMLAQHIPGYDGLIVRSSVKVTEHVLAAANRLKVVGRAGVGVDNIDVDSASRRGIIVMNTPGANTIATAEHTMALLLALCRHVPEAHYTLQKTGQWDRKRFIGRQLHRKTIGIIGMGRVGTQVTTRCQAFGMKVLTYDPYLSDDLARELKVNRVDLDELLARSDFISLHTALTPQTRRIINAETIAKMKDGVRIINAARGALIDESDLVEALQSGKIAGAALDVYSQEPLPADSPLHKLDNVIITPHLAASTVESQRDVSVQIIDQMLNALREQDFCNTINMPIVDATLLKTLQPFLDLAEKVGSLQTQLAGGAIHRVEVEIKGDEIRPHIKPITVAILKGILDPILHQTVNYINAPHLAHERGIAISETSSLPTPNYPNLISCQVEWADGSRMMSATLFGQDEPRLVLVDSYRIDVRPEGILLIIHSQDCPNFIGQVGTLLGKYNTSIADWRTGRCGPRGQALSFINIESDVPDEVIKAILEFEMVKKVDKIQLSIPSSTGICDSA